jgi:hypothetical protein
MDGSAGALQSFGYSIRRSRAKGKSVMTEKNTRVTAREFEATFEDRVRLFNPLAIF